MWRGLPGLLAGLFAAGAAPESEWKIPLTAGIFFLAIVIAALGEYIDRH